MGDLVLGVDFKSKKRNDAPTIQQAFPLGMDTPVEELAWFYESSLGYVEPVYTPPFVAPESDPA